MVKIKKVDHGTYTDGKLFVQQDEVVDVPEKQAAYLCDEHTPGRFERVKDGETEAEKEAARKATAQGQK